METQDMQQTQSHVVMVPCPGMGHLIPFVALAMQLHDLHHNVHVTLIILNDGSLMKLQRKVLQALPDSISTAFLPPVNVDDLPEDVEVVTRIALSLDRSLPALRRKLKYFAESTRLVALVVDIFGISTFEVAKEFGVPPYIFFTTTPMLLSFFLHLPEFDEKLTSEFKDLTVQLPGCVPIHGRDLGDHFQDRKSELYKSIVQAAKQFYSAAGIMVNSFMDLEPGAFMALMETAPGSMPPVYPVGPLTKNSSVNEADPDHSGCLKWLDRQPSGSVLLVSFGSGGTLSHQQLNELALGLEMSGQRFLWVVKSPHEKAANATFFSVESTKDPLEFLPEGFLDRTKDVGLVVPSWAPQVQVLSHGSTGGFLTHCGWNSILESVVQGVPLIAWPLYAEQQMNAVVVTDDLKVALRVKANDDGLVAREDIARYVRELMEEEKGKALRNKMKKLKDAAANALSEGGSSTKSLVKLAHIWNEGLTTSTNQCGRERLT